MYYFVCWVSHLARGVNHLLLTAPLYEGVAQTLLGIVGSVQGCRFQLPESLAATSAEEIEDLFSSEEMEVMLMGDHH